MTEVSPEVETGAAQVGAAAEPSPTQGMRSPGSNLPLADYFSELWRMRHYMLVVAKARVESANVNTSLGKAWLVGEPLLFIAVYGTIFGLILEANRGVDNFIGFLASGQMIFRHNSQAMQNAGTSMQTFEGQIQTMPVPRAFFPISAVATTFFVMVPSFIVMCFLLVLTGERPSIAWLALIPIVAGQILLNIGVGTLFARAIAHIPDLQHLFTHIFRAALYLSGGVFPITFLVADRANGPMFIKILAIMNPIYDYLELGRWALMDIRPTFPMLTIASAAVWSLAMPLIGILFLRKAERRYGFGQIRNAP